MADIKNLAREIVTVLDMNDRTPADVRWVGSWDGAFSLAWESFTTIADREYDSGYGFCEVATDLVVVGDGWWMQRHCYAGREWWQFNTPPRRGAGEPFTRVFVEAADRGLSDPKLRDLNRPPRKTRLPK